ncbi:hypothetical protein J4Q44_G00359150 [Coregonus suidteri]|uniref:Protein-serine/threonine phosphatase n=1 Tax=Coregonus suidteri TaxID=861788 RepID=A0AAN8KF74_9TELE
MSKGEQQDLVAIKELESILESCKLELTPLDEVWPNLYIGNVAIAQNRGALKKLGITHILNAAHFKQGSIGDQDYYGNACVYCGFPTEDSSHFDLSQYFKPAADFIHNALKTKDGKVLVHCIMGISRSATLVLAFLMMHCRLPLRTALKHVTQRRAIYPKQTLPVTTAHPRHTAHTQEETMDVARDKALLSSLCITHIVNTTDGCHRISTGSGYYSDLPVEYYGVVEAPDDTGFNLYPHFNPTADFIYTTLKQDVLYESSEITDFEVS